ncbi:MAG: SDR family oxidoreductase [Pseudomonadota bacterium]
MLLEGQTIIVTGASSGIGAAATRLFAAEGAGVVLGARRGDLLRDLEDEVKRAGGQAVSLAGDVTDARYAADLVSLALDTFGGLDGAFNNAGTTGELGPVEQMSDRTWQTVIDVNLTSGFHAARHQIPALRRRGRGSLVFTSSFVGHTVGLPGMAAYAAAKAGLIGMTQVMAAELGPENIRVNALLPGGTRTAMAGDDPAAHDWISGLHALKRMAEPTEIARTALFLISDQSSFVTGSALIADGGNSITKL